MGARVRAQQGALVEVVCVGAGAARVVRGEAERVKVLLSRDDRVKVIVVFVGRARENGLDDLARDGDWMVFLEVQLARGQGEDGGRGVEPRVGRVCLAVDLDRLGRRCLGRRW